MVLEKLEGSTDLEALLDELLKEPQSKGDAFHLGMQKSQIIERLFHTCRRAKESCDIRS